VGIWTIGYGHVGPEVRSGYTIDRAKALDYLRQDLGHAAFRLSQKVRGDVIDGLTDQQYAALLSFVFNLGAGDWKIWKVLNSRQFDAVPGELMRFTYAGGRQIKGLVNRRLAEAALWSDGRPDLVEAEVPSSVTRQIGMTPPTPTAEKPLAKSKTLWTGAGVAVAGAVQGIQQVQGIVAPQIEHSDLLRNFAGLLAVLIVAGGVAIVVFKWLDARSRRA
jgi:GH24 family phage-related lysozyme (muramidase)